MTARNQPAYESANIERMERALTIREAAEATGVDARTIREKLHAGEMPGAFKTPAPYHPIYVWLIPPEDLWRAGVVPAPETAATDAPAPVDTATAAAGVQLVGSDRFARLRSELAEAVAAVELSLIRAEIDKWRDVAEERARALERADFVLKTVAATGHANRSPAPTSSAASEVAAAPQPPGSTPYSAIPEHVREEARRYAVLSEALRERRPRRARRRRRSR